MTVFKIQSVFPPYTLHLPSHPEWPLTSTLGTKFRRAPAQVLWAILSLQTSLSWDAFHLCTPISETVHF